MNGFINSMPELAIACPKPLKDIPTEQTERNESKGEEYNRNFSKHWHNPLKFHLRGL